MHCKHYTASSNQPSATILGWLNGQLEDQIDLCGSAAVNIWKEEDQMDNTSTVKELIERLDSAIFNCQSRIIELEESGKVLISYIEVLTLQDKPPDTVLKEKVIKAIQVIWQM